MLAEEWFHTLEEHYTHLGLEGAALIAYSDVGSNNADLPTEAYLITKNLPSTAGQLPETGEMVLFADVFKEYQLFLAPTEYSTTAPLKNAAKQYNFRAATMPGFSAKMIPALRIDYNEVSRRVTILKEKLDPAQWAEVIFNENNGNSYKMFFDLRFRKAHLSPGRFPEKSTAGNLPSGETYIVPYEGELEEKTTTRGILPVQIGNDIVRFIIEENKAVGIENNGKTSELEKEHLKQEPAYGNMAELGFGVLSDFGLEPIGEILLDEKLGFHVAFGRSDHFGGAVGPKDFSSPQAVIHLDRIYIPATQPRIIVKSITLGYENNQTERIMEDGKYLCF
ncbi:MAG: hypothetical protein MUF15_14450 [Acidobacteria bacterium]|jgi:hypothetical protein|nr:hypothetical protein [Acidobacteriota bacterium]